ncbi:hypothetical protein [Leifsonia naganoensis]|uniref:Peptidase C39-like domain-containing protein n=1 Tax=Leifsonia naganoensis TaxID=150025 RepID=A0A853DWM1_9MICO|nr:hypothetical protein [Leifsonia naganoensis]
MTVPTPYRFPYESQWGDLRCNEPLIVRGESPARHHDWAADGYASDAEYEFWAAHVCGLACLRSVLRAWRPELGVVPMARLIDGAVEVGALVRRDDTVDGLYYRPFLAWISDAFGIEGEVVERTATAEFLPLVRPGQVVLASVSPEIRWPDRPNERRGGHLVLVHGREGDRFVFHNPSGIGPTAADATADVATFARFHAERGMVLRDGRAALL